MRALFLFVCAGCGAYLSASLPVGSPIGSPKGSTAPLRLALVVRRGWWYRWANSAGK